MKKLILILPVLTGIMWGSVGTFVRKLTEAGADTFTILAIRTLIAALLLMGILLITNKALLKIKIKDAWIFAACGLLGTFSLNVCYTEAINHLSLSLAAVLLSLSPVYVVIIAGLFLKEKLTSRKVLCMILALIGCALVSGLFESGGFSWSLSGIIFGILAGFFCGLYSVFSKVATDRGYDPVTITFYSMIFAFAASAPFTEWPVIGSFVEAAPVGNSLFLLACSAVTIILPYVLFTYAINHGGAGKTTIISSASEPSSAMIFGIILFAEMPTLLSIAGLIITIIALTLLCREDESA